MMLIMKGGVISSVVLIFVIFTLSLYRAVMTSVLWKHTWAQASHADEPQRRQTTKRKQSINLEYNSVSIRHTPRLQSNASPIRCMMSTSSSFNGAVFISDTAAIYGNVIKGDETTINEQIALLFRHPMAGLLAHRRLYLVLIFQLAFPFLN